MLMQLGEITFSARRFKIIEIISFPGNLDHFTTASMQ